MMEQGNIQVEEKVIQIMKEPGKYAVVYLNDEQTPIEFVISSLIKHFQYTSELAIKMTNTIHEDGKGVVALYNFEIAEQYYLKGLSINPNHFGINEYLGELYVNTNRLDKARERLKVLENCKCKEFLELDKAIKSGNSKY